MHVRQSGSGRPQVVIVGGGFAGLAAVRALRRQPVDVTLVDRNAYNVFQPLLYQVATAGLNPGDVTFFLRAARIKSRNTSFRKADVTAVDTVGRSVTLADGTAIDYDYLILATGATTNYFDTPGAQQHALAIYTRSQALTLRDRIFGGAEYAAANAPRGTDLTIAVVGGGATGVEMAGALAELRNDAMEIIYPELDPRHTHVVLIEMSSTLLSAFPNRLQRYAAKALTARGVEIRLNTSVAEVTAAGVRLPGNEFLPAQVVVWAAGVAVPPMVRTWGLPTGRGGRISVGADLQVVGRANVFAVGDTAIGPDPLPQLAQPALQGGRHAARQVAALAAGRPTRAFHYRDKGTMATIGRRAAIADIGTVGKHSIKLTGTIAWLLWLFVHVAMLLGNRNRLATMVNLLTRYLSPSRRTNPIVGDVPVHE